jgi:hypothetical protein
MTKHEPGHQRSQTFENKIAAKGHELIKRRLLAVSFLDLVHPGAEKELRAVMDHPCFCQRDAHGHA